MPYPQKTPHRHLAAATVALLLLLLSACTSRELKGSLYEALYQKQCIEHTGAANCNPQHQSYETYSQQRQELLQRQR